MNNVLEAYQSRPRRWWKTLLVTIIVAIILAWSGSSIEFEGIASKGSEVAYGIVHGIANPDLDLLVRHEEHRRSLPAAGGRWPSRFWARSSAAYWPCRSASSPAATSCPSPWRSWLRALILLIRTIPSLVWALVWIRVTGPGAFCGVVTQSICSIGMISKMYITAIEDLDTRILESMDAAGLTAFQKIRYGVLPQLTAKLHLYHHLPLRHQHQGRDHAGHRRRGRHRREPRAVHLLPPLEHGRAAFLCGMIVLMLVIEFASTRIRRRLAHG